MNLALLFYEISALLGYFGFMIGFMIAAICTAKKGTLPWVLYLVGAGVQLLSLMSYHRTGQLSLPGSWPYWTVYFVLLGIPGIIIILRSSRSDPQ